MAFPFFTLLALQQRTWGILGFPTGWKKFRTGIERYGGLPKKNRYHMEVNNTYKGRDDFIIHFIEHDIVASLDILDEQKKIGKWSGVLNV